MNETTVSGSASQRRFATSESASQRFLLLARWRRFTAWQVGKFAVFSVSNPTHLRAGRARKAPVEMPPSISKVWPVT